MDFIPNTKEQQEEMLKSIGVSSVNDLFKDIPSEVLLKEDLKIGGGLGELEVLRKLQDLASKNKNLVSFAGAGSYNHFIPSVVPAILSRGEFFTAYTPYQPEISQGTLQAIFEYQTMICRLTGMDASNASHYGGATALAESCIMAFTITKRKSFLVLKSIHPEYREVIKTYCTAHNFEYSEVEEEEVFEKISGDTAAVLVQNPNFFGVVSDFKGLTDVVHDKGALLISCTIETTSLGLIRAPGEYADIFIGEGQSFGIPQSFGGPYLGIVATKDKYKRSIPGRIVGQTVDSDGKRGFILTLQAREQHIRREKACSNICTNQGLCALAATIQLTMLGKQGIKGLAMLNLQKSHYLSDKLKENGASLVFDKPFYNEFVIKTTNAKDAHKRLIDNGIFAGVLLEDWYPEMKDCLLLCVTETNTKEEMDKLVEMLK